MKGVPEKVPFGFNTAKQSYEAAFRDELRAHAKNPRALFGLAESLKAQGKAGEEAAARKQFEEGWQHSDMKLRWEDL